ncbi:putative carotenoid cleavage dioxygenase 4 [Citrus sinensis]|uniref:Carotenoid cleavage dioxygenase 4 n=1 Tax=Citrus sinensis TaxID=2711 RepID=A0ACB8IQY9_CITSI|nr:putative carotenoid cleavage dioxygenase 4 [Citrus sinensis]
MDHMNYSSLKISHNHPPKPKVTYYNHTKEQIISFLPFHKPKKCVPIRSSIEKNSSYDTKSSPSLFTNIIDRPLHPSVDPKHVFTGNFAPVDELGPTECPVVDGRLPDSLTGTYIRNGPNPQHMPRGPLHFFEGDGMLHSVQLSKGRAIYTNRHVKTYKYKLERDAGCQIFPNMLSGIYGIADIIQCVAAVARVLMGHINLKKGFGLANTSLAFFSSKLLALGESDLPYIINSTREGDVETVGRWDFDEALFASMTAHPKTDMTTKETFAFKFSPVFSPHLTFFRFDANGIKQKDVPILSINRPTFIHDFAITKRFAIFSETQLAVSAANVMLGKGMPTVFVPEKIPRIGIILKYATSDAEMKWFNVPGFNAMHVFNAWENGDDEIVLMATTATSIENLFHKIDMVHFSLEKVRINLRTGHVFRNILSTRNLELGSINSSYIGKKNRYVFMGVGKEIPKMEGVPLFVPRNEDHLEAADEDDGFVVTYIHDEIHEESKFLLPRRVPYGLHGLFVHKDNH